MTRLLTTLVFILCLPVATPAQNRNILTDTATPERLRELIIPLADWTPFPPASDRAAWTALPEELRQAYIRRGERALDFDWPNLPATTYLEFKRNGNRSNYQNIVNRRRRALMDLVMAECVEGKGRFLEQIANGVWATCEESSWVIPAHINLQDSDGGLPDVTEPVIDLFSAETAAGLAWVHYLLGDRLAEVSELIPERILLEIDNRILTPGLERDDFWWMGFPDRRVNNWNPWINTNWLTCVLLAETDPERRLAGIHKTVRSIDNFLNHYPADGGCDEGPGYWNVAGGRLFDYLEFMRVATDGRLIWYDVPLIREIGRYISKAHIHEQYVVNFADARARTNIAGEMVYRYGKQIGDDTMMAFGAWAVQRRNPLRRGVGGNISRQLFSIFELDELLSAPASQPYLRDAWLPDIQVMFARSTGGSPDGWYVAAKGGHNAESHNHNDVGSFIVYRDGYPALIDVGVEAYSRKTFSRDRYDIWTMQSAYHNLPTVNGIMQQAGRKFAAREVAYDVGEDFAVLRQDIAGAYPEAAGIESWNRTVRLDRSAGVTLTDDWSLDAPTDDVTFSFMTPYPVEVGDGALVMTGTPKDEDVEVSFRVGYDAEKLTPSVEEIVLEDRNLKRVWGDRVYRIRFDLRHSAAEEGVRFTITAP